MPVSSHPWHNFPFLSLKKVANLLNDKCYHVVSTLLFYVYRNIKYHPNTVAVWNILPHIYIFIALHTVSAMLGLLHDSSKNILYYW